MDIDLRAQLPASQQHDIVKAYKDLLVLFTNDASLWSWIRPIKELQRNRGGERVDRAVKKAILEKFKEGKGAEKKSKSRSVLALSVQDFDELSPMILQQTADQVKFVMK